MEDKVIIDTDVLIDFLRGDVETVSKIKKLEQEKELGTTDINVFELYLGAYKSRNQEKNIASVKGLLNSFSIVSTDEDAMEMAAKIIIDLRKKGKNIELRDLFLASMCLVNSCTLLTKNKKHFENIVGLKFLL